MQTILSKEGRRPDQKMKTTLYFSKLGLPNNLKIWNYFKLFRIFQDLILKCNNLPIFWHPFQQMSCILVWLVTHKVTPCRTLQPALPDYMVVIFSLCKGRKLLVLCLGLVSETFLLKNVRKLIKLLGVLKDNSGWSCTKEQACTENISTFHEQNLLF